MTYDWALPTGRGKAWSVPHDDVSDTHGFRHSNQTPLFLLQLMVAKSELATVSCNF